MKTKRIAELDGLRALAVIAVIVFHMANFSGAIPPLHPWISALITYFGSAGVYVFFIISGFIITTLLLREKEKTGTVSLQSFYTRRLLRIFPPLAAYLIFLFILDQVGYITINPVNFLWSSLFLSNVGLLTEPGQAFVAHTWSLSVEEQYYLLLPPLLVIVFKFDRKPLSWLLGFLLCLCLASLKLSKELAHLHPGLINLAQLYKFKYIITGVLIALYRQQVTALISNRSALVPWLLLGLLLINDRIRLPPGINLIASGFEAFLWGIWVMWFVENPDQCRFLRWRVTQWLGACSYSLYLWQQLFAQPRALYHGWTMAQSPLVVIPILFCGTLSYYIIEKPSIRLGQWAAGKSPSTVILTEHNIEGQSNVTADG